VLVVDGDASARSLLARVLSDAGRAVETTSDGGGALAALARRSFALVVMDPDLPGMSGCELATVVVQRWPETAVVIASGAADAATVVKWMQAGAYDYLTKPFDLDALLARLDRALERRRANLESRQQQRQLEVGVLNQTRVARRLFLGAIKSLSSALEAKDDYTRGHSERVSRMAAAIGRSVGLAREEVGRIRLAGRLHDIGKIGVREQVLSKPGPLTEAEYRHVQSHSVVGERILAPTVIDVETVRMVRHHHERYAGGGYPDGLRASEIPLGARVLAVADAYDALTSDRPYRRRLTVEAALELLRAGAGTQWQPTLVEALAQRVEVAASNGPG
jgi:response regulator RpfG family c-di-GMP phosphodiesterase